MLQKTFNTDKRFLPDGLLRRMRGWYHFFLAFAAAVWYGFPARRMTVIGVTGTKGKTTTVALIHAVLAAGGHRVASSSSLRFRIGDEEVVNDRKMTMPGRFFTQRFLSAARRAGCTHAVLEVTSEGITQFRHRFIRFSMAVMTNIAPEHLESHGGYESYLRAKLDLFWRLPHESVAVVNRDDAEHVRFLAATGARQVLYSVNTILLRGEEHAVKNLRCSAQGVSFQVGAQQFTSSLLGQFNAENILAAVACGLSIHSAPEKIATGIRMVDGVPGRMEFIRHDPFAVVVDYAHTPGSLRAAYSTLHSFFSPPVQGTLVAGKASRLICVLGSAGGGRDQWKRPEFGRIAAEFCEKIILTDEDPYDEDPERILEAIESGFLATIPAKLRRGRLQKILDRRAAIKAAIKLAKKGDTVIITGKGAESWLMGKNGARIPWDDRAIVREVLMACPPVAKKNRSPRGTPNG
ncbi:MAG: UDP-N-acetylmuramyl-tripeptide synthetase [bacterium]|nr:UDP-N-acetylmuramyl-tripeptide synthetase [bacterium]MDZ4299639.1 UDP-N-acetylmuramyl-tripeptide synthetase [Candidatus Sungbacteria bacterium]